MININKYPDGTSYVTIPKEWENTFQEITFRIKSYEDLWHLIQLCEVLTWNNIQATITIPNLLDAQADRRFESNQSSGLATIAKILNEFDNIGFRIFHPHNPEVVEALFNRVEIIDNSQFIRNTLQSLVNIGNRNLEKNLILFSSDAGGFKPLMKLCDKIDWQGETFSASKARKYIDGKSHLQQLIDRQDFGGKDILIVDDLCVYGGTFKGLATLLKERNVGKLYLAISHMTMFDLGSDPVTNYFDKVFTTNSKYEVYVETKSMYPFKEDRLPKNLEVIKLFNKKEEEDV